MTTIAKNFAAKASVAFVAAAMIISAFAPAAQAQSSEDLQKMINDLMAQIAALQSQTGVQAAVGTSSVCPYTWTRDLNNGATGADVMKLQQFLNSNPDTRVAASGAGSVGAETQYYGPATAAAVSKFQVMYRAEILSPGGLVNPTGYFGPSSRAKANSVCVAAPVIVVPPTTTPTDPDNGNVDNGSVTLQGEASLDSFELKDGESSIEEGDADVSIGEMKIKFADGDASISRLDITLDGAVSNMRPWDAFETISLWVDGDMVAEVDASNRNDYVSESTGKLRFSGLDIVGMEDETLNITVAATVQDGVDSPELTNDWTLEATSMRYFDADGVATTETDFDGLGAGNDSSKFKINVAGDGEELKLSLASANPNSTDVVVDTTSDTNDVTIAVGSLEAKKNDIVLYQVVVRVETAGATTTDVVDGIRVVIDGQEFDSESITVGGLSDGKSEQDTINAVWYLFDIDGDVTIDEDDKVNMEVVVDLNDTDNGARYANGTTIKALVSSTESNEWQAEGADDLTNSQYKGTIVGKVHTLVAEGILVPSNGFKSSVSKVDADGKIYQFQLEFEVTGVEGNFYIADNAAEASTTPTTGVSYIVTGGAAVVTAVLDSTADEDTPGVFTVREGETEKFTLTVTVDPVAAGAFRVGLSEVNFTANANGTNDANPAYAVSPISDFRTNTQSIAN